MVLRQLKIGEYAEMKRFISCDDVEAFAELSGDKNNIHLDDEAAASSIFGKRIVHGMLVGSLISAVIGTILPGEGTIYLEQDLKFLAPVFLGDTVTAQVSVNEIINSDKGIYRLGTKVINQEHQEVIDGFAVVKYV